MKNMRIMLMIAVITFSSFTVHSLTLNAPKAFAFSDQVIQRGATGKDVIELQARLQYNGYYHGTIDGVYGWSTYWAVRNFQNMFDLEEVDGLVGPKTKDMLKRSTKFYKDFVYEQMNAGRRFTHYGGVPLKIQSAPSEQQIQRARKLAESRKQKQEKNYKAQISQQQAQENSQPQQQGNNQQVQQQGNNKQAQGNKQPAQQQGNKQPAQQQGNKQPAQQQGTKQQAQQQGTKQQAKQQGNKQQAQQPKQQVQQQGNKQQAQKQGNTQKAKNQQKQKNNGKDATAVNLPNGFSQNDIQLMANAVYGEARGESFVGQVAVAAVILNRINSPTFPNTVAGVIFEPRAFTAVADGQIWLTPNENAKKAVLDAINGFDPTEGAIYYFNPDTATSSWIWGRPQIKRIGKHIFCE